MEYNRDQLASLLATAKVTNSDFARLVGVSRVTVYNWLKGGSAHRLVVHKLRKITEAIEDATKAGALPITERGQKKRAEMLKLIVVKHLRR